MEGPVSIQPSSEASVSLDQLPNEKICEIIQNLGPRDLVSVARTSHRIRELAHLCVTFIRIPDGEVVPASFIISLRNLRRVEGNVRIGNKEELEGLSRKIRGPLVVSVEIREVLERYGEFPSQTFAFQDALLETMGVRTLLYPESIFAAEILIVNPRTSTVKSLVLAYDPIRKFLSLDLILPKDSGVDWEAQAKRMERYGIILKPILSILPIRSLRLVTPNMDSPFGKVILPDSVMEEVYLLSLKELTLRKGGEDYLPFYLRNRHEKGLPITLQRLNFLPSFWDEKEINSWILPNIILFLEQRGIPPVLSLTEINGIILNHEDDLDRILEFFPNIRTIGVILVTGVSLEEVFAVSGARDKGITLVAVRQVDQSKAVS